MACSTGWESWSEWT